MIFGRRGAPPSPQGFELIGKQSDISGHLRLSYGSSPQDSRLFVLTLTAQYVACALGQPPSVTFKEIAKYAEQNARELRAKPAMQKSKGFHNLTLE